MTLGRSVDRSIVSFKLFLTIPQTASSRARVHSSRLPQSILAKPVQYSRVGLQEPLRDMLMWLLCLHISTISTEKQMMPASKCHKNRSPLYVTVNIICYLFFFFNLVSANRPRYQQAYLCFAITALL